MEQLKTGRILRFHHPEAPGQLQGSDLLLVYLDDRLVQGLILDKQVEQISLRDLAANLPDERCIWYGGWNDTHIHSYLHTFPVPQATEIARGVFSSFNWTLLLEAKGEKTFTQQYLRVFVGRCSWERAYFTRTILPLAEWVAPSPGTDLSSLIFSSQQ